MRALASWPRPLLLSLAAVFAAVTTFYSALWMHSVRITPGAHLGVDLDAADPTTPRLRSVEAGSPAERAGLHAGDRILAVDGRPPVAGASLREALGHRQPGDRLRLLLAREGAPVPLQFDVVLDAPRPAPLSVSRRVAQEFVGSYPVLFLAVAIPILLLRVEDRNAWLLSLVFTGFIAAAPLAEGHVPRPFQGFALAFKITFYGCWPATFLWFFSVFPAASPIDRRWPWLKTLWLAAGAGVSLPLAAWALVSGSRQAIVAFAEGLVVGVRPLLVVYYFGGFALGLASLVASATTAPTAVRRKSRVILWGTLVGFLPANTHIAVAEYLGRNPYDDFPFWLWAPCVLALLLVPLSFAYAVVKQRVLEVPVLLRRGARYLLVQRGFVGLLLLAGVVATLFFAVSFGERLGPDTQPAGIAMGAGFGTVLVLAGTRVQRRVRGRIDRAFFRGAYDARLILQNLAERARGATSREDLAALIEEQMSSALLPRSLHVFLLGPRDASLDAVRPGPAVPPESRTLSAGFAILAELTRRARPWELPAPGPAGGPELGPLAALDPDCLVPILGRGGRLVGLVVLGARRSEEPYSGEDQRLLASVANQTGIALDSIRLAEEIADRLQSERSAAHEMALARQVQSKLLPDEPPALATLDCAARCVQARAVGGDYYDFLELGPGLTGLVLADISGKGFPAALLMASLQASLRSRLAQDRLDLRRQLLYVNQLLYRSSEPNRYATLFLGLYDDAERRLVYANCGHNPPVVLREDGTVARLAPTAPVLGLLEEWDCTPCELRLERGDLLALFSDGITEARSDADEEFGEERLVDVLRSRRDLSAAGLVELVMGRVTEFSGANQEDDMTLVVARGR